jgi:AcrR family transcriptional regulator
LDLIAEKGSTGFTLIETARRAGVSTAAPYRHFKDKNELLAAVGEQGFIQLYEALVPVRDAEADPLERLLALCRAYVRWAVTHPEHYQVMLGAEEIKTDYPDWLSAGQRAFTILIKAIQDGQAAGVLAGKDPRTIAAPVWAGLHGIASLRIGGHLSQLGINEPVDELTTRTVLPLLEKPTSSRASPAPGAKKRGHR